MYSKLNSWTRYHHINQCPWKVMMYSYCGITVSAILKNTAVVMWDENKRTVVSIVENTLCLL